MLADSISVNIANQHLLCKVNHVIAFSVGGCNESTSNHGALALSNISDRGSLSCHGEMQGCDVI